VTAQNRLAPSTATRQPSTSSGAELPIRCAQLTCNSGPRTMPCRLPRSHERRPQPVKEPGSTASANWIVHISASRAIGARKRESDEGLDGADAVVTPSILTGPRRRMLNGVGARAPVGQSHHAWSGAPRSERAVRSAGARAEEARRQATERLLNELSVPALRHAERVFETTDEAADVIGDAFITAWQVIRDG